MGKGDKRTRRGKIFAGSFGKSRPKRKKVIVQAAAPVEKKPAKRKAKAPAA